MSAASSEARNVDERRHVLRPEGVELALLGLGHVPEEVLGHPGARPGRDGVDRDAVVLELTGEDDRQGGDAGLGGAVVGLAGVAEEARTQMPC